MIQRTRRILALFLVLWGVLAIAGRRLLYFPSPDRTPSLPRGASAVQIATPDGERLSCWWYEIPGASQVTLYLHGNGGYVALYEEYVDAIRAVPQSVLIMDYRGYGASTGSPDEQGLYTDAQAAYDWLRRRGFPAQRIVVQGFSLGSAVAVELASHNPVGAVILEAPFTRARDVANGILPGIGWSLPLGFDSLGRISRLQAPLLVINGDADRMIDPVLGRELFASAPHPKDFLQVSGAGHEDLPMKAGPLYRQALERLYAKMR